MVSKMISQTAETGKDEQVPDVFQPFGNHFLFEDDFYLVLRQVAPIHFFQPDFVAGERVTHQYAVVAGNDDDTLEEHGTYPTRNFATLGPLSLRPPFTGA